jgi:hypothetical protein
LTLPRRVLSISRGHKEEMLMGRISRHLRVRQIELFRPHSRVPAWQTLPKGTRRELEAMLARLLREYRRSLRGDGGREEAVDE